NTGELDLGLHYLAQVLLNNFIYLYKVNCLVKSFWHSESFHPTGKYFPDNWKIFSGQREKFFLPTGKNFLLSVRKPFKFSKIENFLVDLQEKFFFPTGKIFLSDRKSPSFQQEKFFFPTGKVLPSNRKSPSFRQEKSFLPTGKIFLSNRKSPSFQQEKSFLPTGKKFLDNRKNSSFRQDTNECPTYHQPSPFQSQKNRQPQHHNRLRLKHLHFLRLTFYNLNFVRVDMNSERSMRVLYDFVLLP
ncbi:hypothetical protein TVAG_073940, partial [Trichomonas vaginalis G3]